MDKDAIKKIRIELELTQEELATILGVTKAAVTRYESKSDKTYSAPQGETEKKLKQLQILLESPEDKEKLLKLRAQEGGIAALAGLVAMGAATIGTATLTAFPITLGILGVAGAALGSFLTNILKDD